MSDPYPVYLISETVNSSLYSFDCDNGIQYQISFDKISLSSIEHDKSDSICTISFVPLEQPPKRVEDARIKETIAASITAYINEKNVAVVFICESNDNRPHCRQKLFTNWSAKCLDLDNYNYEPLKIEYDDENIVYGGFIWDKNDESLTEYLELVEMEFNAK